MDQVQHTITVEEAGKRYYGITRNASYSAVKRGEIPIIKVGRLFRVPIRAMELLLEQESRKAADAAAAQKAAQKAA